MGLTAFQKFMIVYEVYDIVSDGLWLVEDAYGQYNKLKGTTTALSVFATIFFVVNTVRYFLQTYGKWRLRDTNEDINAQRAYTWAVRQWAIEDLPGITMVTYVSIQLKTFSTFAILSLVGNIGCVILSLGYASYATTAAAAEEERGLDCIGFVTVLLAPLQCFLDCLFGLLCPCIFCCIPCMEAAWGPSGFFLSRHGEEEIEQEIGLGRLGMFI